jgi:hypothetical protein
MSKKRKIFVDRRTYVPTPVPDPDPPGQAMDLEIPADVVWNAQGAVTRRWTTTENGLIDLRAGFRPQHAWRWISHVTDYDARRAAYRVGVRVEVYQGSDPQLDGEWSRVECSFSLAREWLEDQVQPGHTLEQALWPMVNNEVNEWIRRL